MGKELTSIDDLFAQAPFSEPLKAFKENIDAVNNLVGTSAKAIKLKREEIGGWLREYQEKRNQWIAVKARVNEDLQKFREQRVIHGHGDMGKFAEDNESMAVEKERLIDEIERLIDEITRVMSATDEQDKILWGLYDELQERSRSSLLELQILMPMSFIFVVTVWDAFILDTARKILSIHPQLISKSEDKIDLTKSDLWVLYNRDELHDALIESEIRKLDGDRPKLVETFKVYWGIDWTRSTVPLDMIVEIRARRDLWVHNQGRVNKQYVKMVKAHTPLNLGQVAEITDDYFAESLFHLTAMAVYNHRIADEKHYSKSS